MSGGVPATDSRPGTISLQARVARAGVSGDSAVDLQPGCPRPIEFRTQHIVFSSIPNRETFTQGSSG